MWILYNDDIKFLPKLVLLFNAIYSSQNSKVFSLRKKSFYYQHPYNTDKIELYTKKIFDWHSYHTSIFEYHKQSFIEQIKNKNLDYNLYFYHPLFNSYIYSDFKNRPQSEEEISLFKPKIFDFTMNSDNLLINYNNILEGNYNNLRNFIEKEILSSSSLLFDFAYNKINFNYTVQKLNNIEFFNDLLKQGLLDLKLNA